ncbi:GNAT family N-acetyltransferase [Archaeoglobus veneficus]|uniref:GCN5-related N-acetyltransferase n=1 Tax=Archaeoglobus veneficus (strain DSM 11195 / SNP6) TaxID=693661 RepID=F2KNX1_ARCVS|nr:GNAT family N-acetyltransferase [Archaeoglobus veneficus]AEA47448.1 GCN5-related N-acetyltransferase [Archaeoglobus veneficus SNP6]
MLNFQLVFRDKKGEVLTVRPYRPEDMCKLIEMYENYDQADRSFGLPPASRNAIEAWLDYLNKEGYSIVAEHDEQIVGHLALVPFDENLELCMFIQKEYQNRGIGQRMVAFAIEFARNLDYFGIILTTERDNEGAISLFKKMGFEVIGEEGGVQMYLSLEC